MIWLLSAANLIYVVSYSVRDVVLLRGLTIVAATCLVAYF